MTGTNVCDAKKAPDPANITSNTYYAWLLDHAFMLMPAQTYVGQFLANFKDFPPRQKAARVRR